MELTGDQLLNLVSILLPIIAFIAFAIWFLIDNYRFYRFEGNIKRGVKIWSKELSYDSWQYLSALKQDIVEQKKMLFSEYKSDFIRVQDNEILVYSSPKKFESSFIIIGYIDIETPIHELEYRMSLSGLIFLALFTILGVLIFLISFIAYKKAIDSFIERKTTELKLKPVTLGNL